MKVSVCFFAITCVLPLLGNEKQAKAYKKEILKDDQAWAKEILPPFFQKKHDLGVSTNDVLPLKDKDKTFDIKNLEIEPKHLKKTRECRDLEDFLKSSQKKEQFEGTEPLFQFGGLVMENPNKEIDVLSVQKQLVEEEKRLETCREAGCYQVAFAQKRIVEVIPEIKTRIKQCSGHQFSEKFFWKSDAEKRVKTLNKKFSKDHTLVSYHAEIAGQDNTLLQDYFVLASWKHKENIDTCTHPYKDIIIQPFAENDFWHTDSSEGLSTIGSNPNCKLLYSQILEGPETRIIEGKAIFKDVWARNLFFSCESDAESPCVKLRNFGGILIKKKCLKENEFDECDLWEKTYDMGKKAAHQKTLYTFKDQEIWGLDGVFDTTYEKNTNFSLVTTILSVFSDMKKELEEAGELNPGNVEIFRGKPFHCACSFLSGELYDCCKKMKGLAVSAYLARCNEEEVALAEHRQSGQCHYIGSEKKHLQTQTTKVFCCFPTKLARVVQEQGREQLGLKWGTSEEPQCHGLSLEKITQMDFSKIDLAEVIEDMAIDKEDLLKKVKETIHHLQSQKGAEGMLDTEEIVQKQKERILNAH